MTGRTLFYARREAWSNRIALAIAHRDGSGGALAIAAPIAFQPADPAASSDDCLELSQEEAQALVDELWACGIRPSEGSGSAGALAATERHLADMRRIAFAAIREPAVDSPGRDGDGGAPE